MDDRLADRSTLSGIRAGRTSAARRVIDQRSRIATRRAALGRETAAGRGGRPPGRSRLPAVLAALLATFVTGSLLLAGVAVVGTVAAVSVLSDGLPDPTNLGALTFAQPTTVYDRTGKVQLGRFQREQRRVVAYDEVPKLVLDATTTAEDRTFWQNSGFDPAAILSAVADNAAGTSERGASTITQQLVRARLLPEDVIAPGATTLSGRSRARTSCWVMVDAPRSPPDDALFATADRIAAGSNPSFVQKVRSSAVVVASTMRCGTSSKATTRRCSRWNTPSWTFPVRS